MLENSFIVIIVLHKHNLKLQLYFEISVQTISIVLFCNYLLSTIKLEYAVT